MRRDQNRDTKAVMEEMRDEKRQRTQTTNSETTEVLISNDLKGFISK